MSEGIRRVAVTGFGSVGQALAQILVDHVELPIVIVAVVDRGGYALDKDGLSPEALLDAKSEGSVARHSSGHKAAFDAEALHASGADALLELSSTNYDDGEPGWGYVQAVLELGLDVVLASKGSLVAHWDELFEGAERAGSRVGFSATHGAPLPAVDMARYGLAGSQITAIRALFNSTTGLLLEQMETGKSLEESLVVASQAGSVETNPALDIEGWDAAAKCVIVGRSIFGGTLTLDGVSRVGIENLSGSEVREAAKNDTPIKLVSTILPGTDGPNASVKPVSLPAGDPLAGLRDGALGIVYEAEPIGAMFVAGYSTFGAGTTTAASVIRDLLTLR